MPRCLAPSITPAIASGLASSRKKSAGPPMPKEVREASGSSDLTDGSARSHARLLLVFQVTPNSHLVGELIAQLLDVSRAHEEHQVVRSDDLVERLLREDEVSDVGRLPDLVREVLRADAGHVLLARAVGVEHEDAVGAVEGAREIVHQSAQPRVPVGLEHDDQSPVAQL